MSRPPHTTRRSRLQTQLIVVAVIVLVAVLRPRIQEWLGNTEMSRESTAHTSDASPSGSLESGDTWSGTDPVDAGTGPGSARLRTSGRSDRPMSPVSAGTNVAPPTGSSAGASDSRESGDEPPPGKLLLVEDKVFRSTAGVIYGPGSREGHRLKHILLHTRDNPEKPVHGVFSGDRDDVLRWIDLAYLKTAKEDKDDVRKRVENDRTAWTVRMNQPIGFVGGRKGQRQGHPKCRYLRMVFEKDGHTIVTAYPASSF